MRTSNASTLKLAACSACNAARRTFTGSSWLRRTFSIACRSLSLSHTASGASAAALTRAFTVLFEFVAIATARRADAFTDAFGLLAALDFLTDFAFLAGLAVLTGLAFFAALAFFAGFDFFATLRVLAIIPVSPRKAR